MNSLCHLGRQSWRQHSPRIDGFFQSSQEVVSKASEHMIQSVVSLKVTSDIVAQCNASNMMGTEVKVFNIRASKRLSRQGSSFHQFTAS